MKFAFERLDARLHALQFFDQLFIRGLRNRLSLRRRGGAPFPAMARKEATERGGQTTISLWCQGFEIDRASPRRKNDIAFSTLPACRLLFALHRQPPSFSIERSLT
jgi:hypothetical protein